MTIVCRRLFAPAAIAGTGPVPPTWLNFGISPIGKIGTSNELTQRGITSRAYHSGPYASKKRLRAAFNRRAPLFRREFAVGKRRFEPAGKVDRVDARIVEILGEDRRVELLEIFEHRIPEFGNPGIVGVFRLPIA